MDFLLYFISQVDYLTSMVFFLSYLSSLVLLLSSLHFGVRTQPAQFLFYLAAAICGGVTLRSIFLRKNHPSDYTEFETVDDDKIDKVGRVGDEGDEDV